MKSVSINRRNKSFYAKQLTSSTLILIIFLQTFIGVFLPINITSNHSTIEQAQASGESWYETGGTWEYRKQIVIDHTKVSGDLTNFPVLISFTDPKLKDTTNGGHIAQSNGNDILFTSSDGSTKLSHEIETYTNTTGQLIAWVKVPNLSSTTDTILYLYYGNNAVTNQQDPTNVWDSNYVMVQHMKDATASTITDSTSYANNGIKKAANESLEVDGKIGKGQSFDGVNDYINVADSDSLKLTNQFTLSAWLYRNSPDGFGSIVSKTKYGYGVGPDGKVSFTVYRTSGTPFGISSNNCSISGRWAYVTCKYDGFTMSCYIDGVSFVSYGGEVTGNIQTSTDVFSIGKDSIHFIGAKMDEIRVSRVVLSNAWIVTEYNNQVNPSDFMVIKEQEYSHKTDLSFWQYRKAITIDHTKVQGDQTSFPVLISLSQDGDIMSHAKTDGSDIVFSSSDTNWETSDSNDLLFSEIGKYDNTTGQLIAWVNIPNLSSTTDTIIYMYYGNPTLTGDIQGSSVDVWFGNEAIYHLSDSGAAYSLDSTYRGNNATKKNTDEPSQSPGKINQSQSFDGIDDYLSVYNSLAGNVSSEMTLEAWIRPSLSAWTKQNPMVISASGLFVTLQIDYAEGMQPDFGDLRFVDENGTLLRYKIASYTASTSASILLEFPSIPSSEVIYMYYGNSTASNVSESAVIASVEASPWETRTDGAYLSFNNKLWLMGGMNNDWNMLDDIWSSSDGINWTEEVASAPWAKRSDIAYSVFNNKMWVIGGVDDDWNMLDDIWSSSDGINWTEEVVSAPWGALSGQSVAIFDNKLWLMGGTNDDWDAVNSIWSSSDGINWTEEVASAPWEERSSAALVVFNDKLWLMGGGTEFEDNATLNDIWSSSDGINWTEEVASAPWEERVSMPYTVFGGKVWLMGGIDENNYMLNDIWSSSDGINWTEEVASAPWPARSGQSLTFFNSKFRLIGGMNNDWNIINDVWSSSDGINWNHDSAPTSSYTFSDAQDVSGALGTILGKGTNYNLTVNDSNIPLDEWTHIALTNNGTTQKYYINGNLISSRSKTIGSTDSNLLKIGDGYYSFPFSGSIDEVRISNTAYSANQIKTQHNNQSSPSAFYALGKQQTYGVNDPTQVQYFPTAHSIEITWESNNNDNTTEYYIENITNGTNSNWQTGLSYNFQNLLCNQDYTFKIKARKNGLETLPDTYLLDTAYCSVSRVSSPSNDQSSNEEETADEETNNPENDTETSSGDDTNTDNNTSHNDTTEEDSNTNTPAPSTITLPPITQTVSQGTSGSTVQTLQNNLKALGYFPSNIESNGNFGPTTLQAVKDFQKAHGINPTGFVGPITLKALNNENIVSNSNYQFNQDLKYNDKSEDVKQLQTNLKERAFFPSSTPSTGWFGPITQKAVNLFKKIYGLVPDGIVDKTMREILGRG